MNNIYLYYILITLSVLNAVCTERSWFQENDNADFREPKTYNAKVYFPGRTNEREVEFKRMEKEPSNSFANENNSNRIDEDERTNVGHNSREENEIKSSAEIERKTSFRENPNSISNSNENKRTSSSSRIISFSSKPTSASSSSSKRLCERKYAEYIQRIFPQESDTAQDANDSEFNGRILAAPGEYPHMSALGFPSKNGEVDYKCGGSLISENFVITAAHCANFTGQQPTKVRIGDLNLMVEENNIEPQIREIKKIYIHSEYKSTSYYNDIALLELTKEVDFTEFVRPIRLWTRPTIPFLLAYAMGYGSTDFAKERTNRLTNLNMTIVLNDECNLQMPKLPEAENGILASQICARDFAQNRDTCQGDSGGPLQLNIRGRRRRNRLHYHLIGITSYGLFCRSGYPSIFTRVCSYLDWIENIVWRENLD